MWVNANHHNGKSDNIIKDVTTGTRKVLPHADYCWLNAIHASLWPVTINNYFV